MNDFVKPANNGPEIQAELSQLHRDWFGQTNLTLQRHYDNSIKTLTSKFKDLKLPVAQIQELYDFAMKRARKNFGQKLHDSTISKFKSILFSDRANPPTAKSRQPQRPNVAGVRVVKGHSDPLSNFFPCQFRFRNILYRSVEHAYQTQKAWFHGQPEEFLTKIQRAKTAAQAKSLARNMRTNRNWDKTKATLMAELLVHKFQQVRVFRDNLIATRGQTILHSVPDLFWGTGSETRKGKNALGRILWDVLDWSSNNHGPAGTKFNFLKFQKSKIPSASPHSISTHNKFSVLSNVAAQAGAVAGRERPTPAPRPSLSTEPGAVAGRERPTPAPRSPTNKHNSPRSPWSLLPISPQQPVPENEDFPSLPEASPAPKSPRRSIRRRSSITSEDHPSPKRTDRRATTSPRTVRKSGGCKSDWTWPVCDKKILIVGDSNLARITKPTPVNMDIVSFPGANFQNFIDMLKKFEQSLKSNVSPIPAPEKIMLNVGINNRNSNPDSTSIRNFNTLVGHLTKCFPSSIIYFAEINFSASLYPHQRLNLSALNEAFKKQEDLLKIMFIDKFPHSEFKTEADNIHWTMETANLLFDHWVDFIEF